MQQDNHPSRVLYESRKRARNKRGDLSARGELSPVRSFHGSFDSKVNHHRVQYALDDHQRGNELGISFPSKTGL